MTAPIVKVMVANKLPATGFAEVFLLVVAGFAVSLYILPTATGTANGILSFHTSNIPCLRCFLFARRLSAYILGHHPGFLYGEVVVANHIAIHRKPHTVLRRFAVQPRTVFSGAPCLKLSVDDYIRLPSKP